jgi:hypothetical protein
MNIYKKASLIVIGTTLVATTAQIVTNILVEARTVQSYIDCPLTVFYEDKSCTESITIVKDNVKELIMNKVKESNIPEVEEALKLLPLIIYTDKDNVGNEE